MNAEKINEKINPFLERLTSPISGTFIVTWVIVNWKIVLYLFDSTTAPVKILTIRSNSNSWECLILPLMITSIYLLIMPFALYGLKYVTDLAKTLVEKKEIRTEKDISIYRQYSYSTSGELLDSLVTYIDAINSKTEDLYTRLQSTLDGDGSAVHKIQNIKQHLSIYQTVRNEFQNTVPDIHLLQKIVNNPTSRRDFRDSLGEFKRKLYYSLKLAQEIFNYKSKLK